MNLIDSRKKAKVLILCEGPSDIAFIYMVLTKWLNCRYVDKNIQSKYQLISINTKMTDDYAWYYNDDYFFMVCAVRGSGNYLNFTNKHFDMLTIDEYFNYYIIMRDRDNNTDEKIYKQFENSKIKLTINDWMNNEFVNWSNDKFIIKSYLCVIPDDCEGCLEDLILESLTNEDDIRLSAIYYIDNLSEKERKYLNHVRDFKKAKVGVAFTLIDPQSTFSSFTSRISNIDIDKETIINYLSFLKMFNIE